MIPALNLTKAAEILEDETPPATEYAENDADIKPEDAEIIQNQFTELYAQNTDLQAMIPEDDVAALTLIQKYQILEQFMDEEKTNVEEADSSEYVEHDGKMYR